MPGPTTMPVPAPSGCSAKFVSSLSASHEPVVHETPRSHLPPQLPEGTASATRWADLGNFFARVAAAVQLKEAFLEAATIPVSLSEARAHSSTPRRWVQLVFGLLCMMDVSSPQYVWTLFTKPMLAHLGGTLAQLQVTFSILIVLQTFFSPFQGFLVDRFGPRLLLSVGALLTGASWLLAAGAKSLTALYLSYGLFCGLGTGIIFVGCVGRRVKEFRDKRGFAAGVVSAGYGMGEDVTTFPISASLAAGGCQQTVTKEGFLLGGGGPLAPLGLKRPPAGWMADHLTKTSAPSGGVGPKKMLLSPVFWTMFVMMTMMSTSGLMVISQMATFAKDFGIAGVMIGGMAAIPLAL